MKELEKAPRPHKAGAQAQSYVAALIQMLESVDFEEAAKAVRVLGDTGETSAIKPLVAVVKNSAWLRAAAIAALKKIATKDEAAAAELAMALTAEKGETAEAGVRLVTPADRRRSPRVLLEIPVIVAWTDEKGEHHTEMTTTEVVNAFGALLSLKNPVVLGLELQLTNTATQVTTVARVVWVGSPAPGGGQHVGIELGNPDPDFWWVS